MFKVIDKLKGFLNRSLSADELINKLEISIDRDLEIANIFIGKIIETDKLKCLVVHFDADDIYLKIIEISDPILAGYLDVNKIYKCFQHKGFLWQGNLLLWEFEPSLLKRNISTLMLQWKKGSGWSFDLEM